MEKKRLTTKKTCCLHLMATEEKVRNIVNVNGNGDINILRAKELDILLVWHCVKKLVTWVKMRRLKNGVRLRRRACNHLHLIIGMMRMKDN